MAADFVIVGGGSAGCVLAARLSEDAGCRVLLVEAGGQDKAFYQLTQRDARRPSTATAYLRPAERRGNLAIRTGVQVRRIVVEAGRCGWPRAIRARHR